MQGPPPGPFGEDITWPDQVAPRGRRRLVPEKSSLKPQTATASERLTLCLLVHRPLGFASNETLVEAYIIGFFDTF